MGLSCQLGRGKPPLLLLQLLILLSWGPDPALASPPERRDRAGLREVVLAVILPRNNTAYPWSWPRVGPALERALGRINADPALLPAHRVRYVFENSENEAGICSESIAPLVAVDLKFSHSPWAFIGPGCDYTSSSVGLFTTHWGLPMVTAGAPAIGFYDTNVYNSITNTGPTHKKLGQFAVHLQRHFGWRRHALLMFSDNKVDDRPYYFAAEGLYSELGSDNITTADLVLNEQAGPVPFATFLQDIKQSGRVVYVCCAWDTFRQLMVNFRKAGLPQEEYVFFYIDVFGRSLDSRPARPWAKGDADDPIAKEAFRSVKIVTYREPQNPEYKEFVTDLKADAKRLFNFTMEDSLMNLISGGFYDGVMLYAQALNETLALRGGGMPPGKDITKRMWNRTYYGVTGLVQIDENGDREIDFALWDMTDIDSGIFQIVSVYNGT
ncbi:hypothetical protein AAFF_G00169550 [Aldrovandia affinis]|uniref:Receptor ligand binding region domain-containing protein n=1 Tax=Aldrovandia affinis TaxID=143900 RepID=A0AAD7RLX0_9TELE|nr:hypothetical protein AAFF_G00169550 [Aldrovandia affinis]